MRLVFDDFEIDPEEGRLLRRGRVVPLERRAFDMLCYLAARPGRLIGKDELLAQVWQARALSDGVLTNTAAKLRKALGQSVRAGTPLETVRGRGYRWVARGRDAELPPQPGPFAADPYVGRRSVIELLTDAVEQALHGQGRSLLITGEAGMGKTRTLRELGCSARARGMRVWEGLAVDGVGAPPYWPWVQILRAAFKDLTPPRPGNSALALLAPELFEDPAALAGGGARGASDLQAMRFRLFDELVRFLEQAGAHAPCLIAIDDLHWADRGTVELLAYAAHALARRPIVFATTLREHDLAARGEAGAALRRLGRLSTQISLQGLLLSEVAELVVALRGQAARSPALAQAVYARTQGNPLFVREVLGLLSQRAAASDPASISIAELPSAVRDVIHDRIAPLPAQTRELLAVAAAIGQQFDASLLAQLLECDIARVLETLEPARRLGLVECDRALPQRLAFGHALVRETLYADLGLATAGALHAQLARLLASAGSAREPRRLGELARHQLLAAPADLGACVRDCREAAAAARARSGFEAAADLLAGLLDKLAGESGYQRTRGELLLELGIDRLCAGELAAAFRALGECTAIASAERDLGILARAVLVRAGMLELGGVCDEVEVRADLQAALEAVADDPDLSALLLASRAEVCFELPAATRSALLSRADALAAHRGTPEVLLSVALSRAAMRDPTELDHNRRAVEDYRALARRFPDAAASVLHPFRRFSVELTEYLDALTGGDLTLADEALLRCRARAEQSPIAVLHVTVELMRAGRALGDGRLDDLARHVERLSEAHGTPGGFGLAWHHYRLRLSEAAGRFEPLDRRAFATLDRSALRELPERQQVIAMIALAALCAKSALFDQARGVIRQIPADELERMPVRFGDLANLCLLAETYALMADRPGAEQLLVRLEPHAELNAVGMSFDYHGAVAHFAGRLELLLGHRARARAHLLRAEQINQRLRMPLQLAQTRALLAQLDGSG